MRTTNTRSTILELTRTILRTEGVEAVSMRRLAKELGLSAMAPYKHFPSREALLYAVAQFEISKMLPYLEVHLKGVLDPVEGLRVALRSYAMWAMENPDAYPFLVPSGFSNTLAIHPRILAQDPDPNHRPGRPAFNVLIQVVELAVVPMDKARLERIVLEAWLLCAGLAALAMPTRFDYGGPDGILFKGLEQGFFWDLIDTWIQGLEAKGLLRK